MKPLTESPLTSLKNGVIRLPENDLNATIRRARKQGLAYLQVDLGFAQTESEVLTVFATKLRFPPWFGHNWDALADCLADLSWIEAPGYVLHLTHFDQFQMRAPALSETLENCLNDVAHIWMDDEVVFWVLIDTPLMRS